MGRNDRDVGAERASAKAVVLREIYLRECSETEARVNFARKKIYDLPPLKSEVFCKP